MSVLLIYNSSAGTGEVSRDHLLSLLRSSGFDPEAISSDDELLPRALEARHELLVAAGGDGTVARVLTQLADRSTRIAILPTGGSNNIACALGIEGDLEELVTTLRDAPAAELDIGVAEGVWGRECFVESAGLGTLTAALLSAEGQAKDSEDKLLSGREALAEAVAAADPTHYQFELDGHMMEEELLMLEVLNMRMRSA